VTGTAVTDVHVDRDAERALFRSMLERSCQANLLLIRGPGGMGKTSLLDEFWQDAADHPRARIDLKLGAYTVSDILEALVDSLGGTPLFPRYEERLLLEFARAGDVNIQYAQVKEVIVNAGPDVELRTRILTDSFFQDLAVFGTTAGTTTLIFDTYNEASPDVQNWLGRRFLRLARTMPHVTVVIGGRSVPDVERGWDDRCISRELPPLEPDHIRELLDRTDTPYEEAMILGIFAATQGVPLPIATAAAWLKQTQGRIR
jgi:hypothetical protein